MFLSNFYKQYKIKLVIVLLFSWIVGCQQTKKTYSNFKGNVFGTTFHIKYLFEGNSQDLNKSIDSLFEEINSSLSTYRPKSLVSSLNDSMLELKVDDHFKKVFVLSKEVHQNTSGYFDPTVGKMVNYWGFGPDNFKKQPTNRQVDSLMNYVGFDKVVLKNGVVVKSNPNIYLDFNAIAKGYGVDVVGSFLESKKISNYLVEIGGEIRVRGKNPNNEHWSVGIEDPNFDGSRSFQKITRLNNEAIATSGNYRKFKIDVNTGEKIAHTLDPKTGFPAKTDLLSVSVIAPMDCAEVDAYATAFMAMGFDKAKVVAENFPQMKIFCIYLKNNELKTYATGNLQFID